MSGDQNPGIALLSLDGGRWENLGALTQIHVVEDILHAYEVDSNLQAGSVRVCNVFDFILGTGTGGLVACMLGPLKMSTKDAKEIYLRIRSSDFLAKEEMSERVEILKSALQGFLDSQTDGTEGLMSATQMADLAKLTPDSKFAVTAMAAANLSKPIMLRAYQGRGSSVQCTILEALLATLSDAQMLPPVPIGEGISESFIATTIGHCNPTTNLLEEIPSIFKSRAISVIVNIGSGLPNPVALTGQETFVNVILDLSKSCHTVFQNMASRFSRYPGLFVRLDVDGFDISETIHPGEAISHSRVYMNKEIHERVDGLIHSLMDRPKRLSVHEISGLKPGLVEKINDAVESIQDSRILEQLIVSTEAAFSFAVSENVQRQSCTPGTRVAIIRKMLDWVTIHDSGLESSLFWLYGLAGTGKTTILHDICERLQKRNLLASSYFCSIQLSSGNSRCLVPTIAKHLASRSLAFESALISQLRRDPDLPYATLKLQFEHLLCKPWESVTEGHANQSSSIKVVTIDALDECDRGEEFLDLLLNAINEGRLEGIKFIVTSRPVLRLLTKVREMHLDAPQVSLHEIPKEEVDGDIGLYLEAKLELAQSQINDLVARADGLFIYASTLVKYLSPSHHLAPSELERRIERVLSRKAERGSIYALYKRIVEAALSLEDIEDTQGRWAILHAIICAAEPPSSALIASLLGVDLQLVIAVVESLHAVLFTAGPGGPIYILHASFHDFIISVMDGEFRCQPPSVHCILARACLTEMIKSLRFNICSLESSFVLDVDLDPSLEERVAKHIGSFLAYASRNWLVHLKQCDNEGKSSILPLVQKMLDEKGIFWIEVMSLLQDVGGCKEMLKDLTSDSLIGKIAPDVIPLASEVMDLASLFNTVTFRITSHLYLSCLALSEASPVLDGWRNCFSHFPQVITRQRTKNRHCTVVINVEAYVNAVAFCPSGKRIVSGSSDNTVCIWDAESGAKIQQLEGQNPHGRSISFSPDGKHIVSGCVDGTICIWDVELGRQVQQLNGHTSCVPCVVFSPDMTRIVSGSFDASIRIWDVKAGKQLRRLDGHTYHVQGVVLSPDGKLIVSGSGDTTIRIWDADSGKQLQQLQGHKGSVLSVAFSTDGKRIASGSVDATIRIWDAKLGKQLWKLKGHASNVNSVTFSPDCEHILSGSDDATARIWSVSSGKELQQLTGHTSSVQCVSSSPAGTQIASGSDDKTVRLWNFRLGRHLHQLKGHTDCVSSVAFSPNGNRIISGSWDGTAQIWDAESGEPIKQLKGHASRVNSVAFSPDGKRVATVSVGSRVHLWDVASGKQLFQIKDPAVQALSVAFSPDGQAIVFGSKNAIAYLWDINSGKQILQLHGSKGHICAVAFSPNGKCIASGSADKTIRIWSAGPERQLDGHRSRVNSVSFSPDGQYIVSGSSDETVRVWDAESGTQVHQLNGHTNKVLSVAYSPDGKCVVSGSGDRTVRIWDTESGMQLRQLEGHAAGVLSVAFSPDGLRIVSGSADAGVNIWNAELGKQPQWPEGHSDSLRTVAFSLDDKRNVPAKYNLNSESKSSTRPKKTWKTSVERMSNFFGSTSSKSRDTLTDQPSHSNLLPIPLAPVLSSGHPGTVILTQTSPFLYCRNDGWVVTLEEPFGTTRKILWIPPTLRPFNPSMLLGISREGFNSIELAGCVFGEGWEQCYSGCLEDQRVTGEPSASL
ncbi:hypothetical protein DL96DRAFT_1817400 [Flagelloscypha sp. PMI_526]|nr:hypothetical protein DL96DRAFT_1817400 [Flagelloscypha sp. PMI_526]